MNLVLDEALEDVSPTQKNNIGMVVCSLHTLFTKTVLISFQLELKGYKKITFIFFFFLLHFCKLINLKFISS